MSTFDILFWLLIVLIGVLAYAIESGLTARHRTLVLSSIMSATLAAIYMMFLIEDNSEFGAGERSPKAKQEQQSMVGRRIGSGDGNGDLQEAEVVEAGTDADDPVSRFEDGPLLKKPGGFRDCPACPLMTMVPAGRFIIGSPADEAERQANEGPQKVVRIPRPFTVSRYEIQLREFAAFVTASRYNAASSCSVDGKPAWANWQKPGFAQATADHPVVCLTWTDARAYAEWLTKETKRVYRLPSEAEWEYVARGGASTAYWMGRKLPEEAANYAGTIGGTVKGGTYLDNGFKVFDVAGNVAEMTEDCWSGELSKVPASGVADRGLGDCSLSPLRGGSWASPANELRAAFRQPFGHDVASNTVGVRLVREIK